MDVGRRKTQKWPLSPLSSCVSLGAMWQWANSPCLPSFLLLETAIKIQKTAPTAAHFNFPNLHNLCLISANHKRRLFARKFCGAPSSLFMRALQGRLIKTGANCGLGWVRRLRWTHRRNDTGRGAHTFHFRYQASSSFLTNFRAKNRFASKKRISSSYALFFQVCIGGIWAVASGHTYE